MSEETASQPTPADHVAAEIRRYGDEFVPGSHEKMAALWANVAGNLPPDKRAEKVAELLAGPLADRWRNPEFKPPALENGSAPSPLRKALERHAGQLAEGAVDELASKLATSAVGKSPGQIAGMVHRFLAGREADQYQRDHRDSAPAHEGATVDRLLKHFGGDFTLAGMQALARDRGRELARLDDRAFVTQVGSMLRSSVVASKYAGTAIDPADPRLKGVTADRPARAPDGRFAQPPTKPARKPSVNF